MKTAGWLLMHGTVSANQNTPTQPFESRLIFFFLKLLELLMNIIKINFNFVAYLVKFCTKHFSKLLRPTHFNDC